MLIILSDLQHEGHGEPRYVVWSLVLDVLVGRFEAATLF